MEYVSGIKNHFLPKKYSSERQSSENINTDTDKDTDKDTDTDKGKKQYKTKVIQVNSRSINEIKLCESIRNIPYYDYYYNIIIDYEVIRIGNIDGEFIWKEPNANETSKHLLIRYNNHERISLTDYFLRSKTFKQLLFRAINSVSKIVSSLIKLEERGITFFDISPQNIVFYSYFTENPILTNFENSLNSLNKNTLDVVNIVDNFENFTYQPIEIHLIFYLIKNNIDVLSDIYAEQICDAFLINFQILTFFSSSYKESYRNACRNALSKYIGASQQTIINDVIERKNKWDIYGLSVIYLHVFGCIMRRFSLKGTAITKMVAAFSKNIHPDPDKRMSLCEFYEFYNKLVDKIDDWNFIKNIDNEKLQLLFAEMTQ